MKNTLKYILLLILFQSCANYKLNYTSEAKNWKQAQQPTSDMKLKHSVFLIGDTGNAKLNEKPPLFNILKNHLDDAGQESSIVFLGDNIYPVGMPPKDDPFRTLAEHKLNVQLEMLNDYQGNIMFIPGNHDWYEYGIKGVKRQEKYIEKHLNKLKGIEDYESDEWKNYFLPGNGCGDPQTIVINDQLVIVIIDSAWWVRNWDTDQNINEGCDIKSRSFFKFQFEEAVRKYRNRNVIVAMHHPLFSNGPHGGHFTAKEHIFPLTPINKKLYVPLPGLGSLISFFRGTVGVPEDLSNGKYKAFISDVLHGLTKNGNFIVASGHEHNLQYIEKSNQIQIVSGAGSKQNPTVVGDGGEFGYGRKGFSKIDFYEDGQAWVEFYALNNEENNVELVFKKKIKDQLKISKDNIPTSFPEYEKKEKTIVRQPNNYDLKKVGFLHKAILGEHYLQEYMVDYPFDVLDLETYKGGLTPVKRGGGNQTNSLRFVDEDGRQYTMRSLTKDASRALPYPANQIAATEKILQDNFLSAYPFAASIVPKMADAANVYHANPALFYVPKQPRLGLHNDIFGGDVYLVEERVGGNWDNQPTLGSSKKIISTLDVSEKITTKHKHRVDHEWLVRSKLFDMLIQDWDRHDDQWRWATIEQDKGKLYRPIPRDRDQAFSKYDGILMKLVAATSPFYKSLQNFKGEIKDIRWASWNGKYFDMNFLGEATRADWIKEGEFIQQNVTDEVIEAAFNEVPEAAKNETWKSMIEKVKSRRDNIVKYAKEAYAYNSFKVDVLGTAQKDYFEISRGATTTSVKGFALKKGKKGKQFFERVFENEVTREINIYGFEGEDKFILTGNAQKGIKIRIIGGLDNDELIDQSYVKSGGKKTLFYDSSIKKNKMELGKEAKDKTSKHVKFNAYDRKHFHYQTNWTLPTPILGYNADQGLNFGLKLTRYRYQFKKVPFGQSHTFLVDYASSPNSVQLGYTGLFVETVGAWDLETTLQYNGVRTAFNYFGLGNESVNIDHKDLFFNRVQQEKRYAYIGLAKRFATDNGTFSFGPLFERTDIQEIADRVLTIEQGATPDIFDDINYAGAKMSFNYKSVDSKSDPHKGFALNIDTNAEQNLDVTNKLFFKFGTDLTIYTPLTKKQNIVLATKLNYSKIYGEYDFFKTPTIGGPLSLRGYRFQRFRAPTTFTHMNDLRVKALTSINKVAPFSLGIHAGFDYGRVWEDGVDSDKWHYSYGGGIYLSPLNALVISAGMYFNEEDEQFIFKIGQLF